MIKLFISDLDGTLLGMDHFIKNEDADALKRLVERGVPLTVASGRMDHEIKEVLKRVGVIGHRVSQNGAFVFDKEDGHIHSKTFDRDLAKKVMASIDKEPMIKTVSTADETYTREHNKWIDIISEQLFHDIRIDPNMTERFGESIFPSKISLHGKEQNVIDSYNRIDDSFGKEIDCFISHETCVDIMPKAINKGSGIRSLIEILGIDPHEVACVGDSFNDVAMFELTPHSYVMSTAHNEVIEKANTIVDHVHEAIEDLEKKGLL
ncbi:Cof-type HAD-IIB family hydrolase [Halobacillus sp. BBL2006]|uniref:Cof-type HAD-IIB family hydrolase n=1 Tax=Halobacillus sp. BBL2006 TaxID=1543706 RepID=UPI000543E35B|nr:Cof-type HAD-IIB family hydrolase [Halobacillus sp. BBL2006]KHE71141.1 HAD family hydrolase [Halobacillus sp. BBL2006]